MKNNLYEAHKQVYNHPIEALCFAKVLWCHRHKGKTMAVLDVYDRHRLSQLEQNLKQHLANSRAYEIRTEQQQQLWESINTQSRGENGGVFFSLAHQTCSAFLYALKKLNRDNLPYWTRKEEAILETLVDGSCVILRAQAPLGWISIPMTFSWEEYRSSLDGKPIKLSAGKNVAIAGETPLYTETQIEVTRLLVDAAYLLLPEKTKETFIYLLYMLELRNRAKFFVQAQEAFKKGFASSGFGENAYLDFLTPEEKQKLV